LAADPQCPSCGSVDTTVIGLEEGQLRLKCDGCLADWLEPNGPDLKPCESGQCNNWVPEGTGYCLQCQMAGWAVGKR